MGAILLPSAKVAADTARPDASPTRRMAVSFMVLTPQELRRVFGVAAPAGCRLAGLGGPSRVYCFICLSTYSGKTSAPFWLHGLLISQLTLALGLVCLLDGRVELAGLHRLLGLLDHLFRCRATHPSPKRPSSAPPRRPQWPARPPPSCWNPRVRGPPLPCLFSPWDRAN